MQRILLFLLFVCLMVPLSVSAQPVDKDMFCFDSASGKWGYCELGIASNPQTGDYAIVTGDKGKMVTSNKATAAAWTIAAAGGQGFDALWNTQVCSIGVGKTTITPTTSTIGGSANLVLYKGDCALIKSDGANYQTVVSRNSVEVELVIADFTADVALNSKYYFLAGATGSKLLGMVLAGVELQVVTAGTTGVTTVGIDRCAPTATGSVCSGTVVAMLSTAAGVDSGENSSVTAAAAGVINTANDDILLGSVLRLNVNAVSTTAPKGLIARLIFRRP